ncbi:PKD domain-containing protein, partial [Zunongwangia sp. F297]
MKNIKLINGMKFSILAILVLAVFSCVDDDYDMGNITNPSNLSIDHEIVGATQDMPDGDGSGEVQFTANAEGAITYKFIYGDGFEDVSSTGAVTHSFSGNGVNDYNVTIIASGAGGAISSMSTEVTVFSSFDDPETKQLLTGGDTKTWYVAAAQQAHLGVGPVDGDMPSYYAAPPFDKLANTCFYNDELVFSLNGENIIYELNNMDATFFNASYNADFGGGGPDDQCLPLDTSGEKNVSLSAATSGIGRSTGTSLNFGGGGFMSYYIGTSTYEVLSISENAMEVRAIPGNDPALAWYLKFT